jgi:hypothetical protein
MTHREKPLGLGPLMIFINSPIVADMSWTYKCAPLHMRDQIFFTSIHSEEFVSEKIFNGKCKIR